MKNKNVSVHSRSDNTNYILLFLIFINIIRYDLKVNPIPNIEQRRRRGCLLGETSTGTSTIS